MISSNLSWTGKRCLAACCSQEPTAGMNHLLPDTSAQTQTPAELRPHAESSASAPRRDPNPELFVELHAESLLVAGTKAAGREPGGGGEGGRCPVFFLRRGWCGNGAAAASTKAPFIGAARRGPLPSHSPPLPRSSSAAVQHWALERQRANDPLGGSLAGTWLGCARPAAPGSARHRVGAGAASPSCKSLLCLLLPSVVSWAGGKPAPFCTTELGKGRSPLCASQDAECSPAAAGRNARAAELLIMLPPSS